MCGGSWCSSKCKPYQPDNSDILKTLVKGGRTSDPKWFRALSMASTEYDHQKSVFLSQSYVSPAEGFNTWNKTQEKYSAHEASPAHCEASKPCPL